MSINHRRADQDSRAPEEAPKGAPERVPLAAYAVDERQSRGRLIPEAPSPTRSLYARDRDRVLHSTAFRRLNYKTQVFLYHEGDHYRSRLTHSLEVAQIARALARSLRLDEDLTEALALAHDLGHPPFGHAGERALDAAMREAGGFDHNAQSLRVVTTLERKYASFDGLNLTWETLEGLVKHNGPLIGTGRSLPESVLTYCAKQDLDLATYSSVEAQVAALADDIAYNNHDVDDGYRADCFTFDALAEVPIMGRLLAKVDAAYPGAEAPRRLYEVNRRLITAMVNDVIAETRTRLAALSPQSADDVRHAGHPVVAFSEGGQNELEALRAFLSARVYRHERVEATMVAAQSVVADLFRRYSDDLDALPPEWSQQAPAYDARAFARHVADFIAGMTDRYALVEHSRLFDATPDLR